MPVNNFFFSKYFMNIWMWVEPSAGGGEHVTCMLSTVRLLSSLYEALHGILSLDYAGKQKSQVKYTKYIPWFGLCVCIYVGAIDFFFFFKFWNSHARLNRMCGFWCNPTEAVTEHLSAGGSVAPQNPHCCSSLRREECEECVFACVLHNFAVT